MNRLSLAVVVLVSSLVAVGCGTPCGPSNCGGCCDAQGACQVSSNNACGLIGQTCSVCTALQSCVEGTCGFESGAPTTAAGGIGATNTGATNTAASNSSTGTLNSSSTATGGSSGTQQTNSTTSGGTTAQQTTTAASSTMGSGFGPTSTSSSSGNTTTGGSSGGTSTGSSGLPLCSPCSQLADCASQFCNTSVSPGYCDTADACSASGGPNQDCSPYACGAGGDCLCPQAGTSSGGTTGSSSCNVGCASDADCQDDCGTPSSGVNCCDASGICYVSNSLSCPVPTDAGGGTTGY